MERGAVNRSMRVTCENALEAEWQEQEELGGEEVDEQASIMEEQLEKLYGKGFRLLRKAGCSAAEAGLGVG